MGRFHLAAATALTLAGLVAGLIQAQPLLAFGGDNECATLGDCQATTCVANAAPILTQTADTAVIFGSGGGGVSNACGNGVNPNLSVVSTNAGGLGFASAAFSNGFLAVGVPGGADARASADGAGSLAGAQAFNGTVAASTTAGSTGLAIGTAVNTRGNGNEGSAPNGAFGLSAFGGETLAAPNVTFAPGQTGCVSVGNAISSTFTFGNSTSSLCVGNHVVIAGQ